MIKFWIRHPQQLNYLKFILPVLQGTGTTDYVHLQVSLTHDNLKGNAAVLVLFTRQIQQFYYTTDDTCNTKQSSEHVSSEAFLCKLR